MRRGVPRPPGVGSKPKYDWSSEECIMFPNSLQNKEDYEKKRTNNSTYNALIIKEQKTVILIKE